MSGLNLLWDLDQEERISNLEKELREQKEHIEKLSKWIIFLAGSVTPSLPIEAQGYNLKEAHSTQESNRGS